VLRRPIPVGYGEKIDARESHVDALAPPAAVFGDRM